MAYKTPFGDPAGALIQAAHTVDYYEDWYYFGQSDGYDTYAHRSFSGTISLSIVYSDEPSDYGSPYYEGILRDEEWHREHAPRSLSLALKVQAFLIRHPM